MVEATAQTTDNGQADLAAENDAIRRRLGAEFIYYDAGNGRVSTPDQKHTIDVGEFRTCLSRLATDEGGAEDVLCNPNVVRRITREEITALEVEGLVLDGISREYPHGGVYIKDLASCASQSVHFSLPPKVELTAVRITNVLKGVAGLVTRPPIEKIPETLHGLPRFPVHSLCAAVYRNDAWSETHVFPDGRWVVEGFDNGGWQYGQGAFEGIVANEVSNTPDEPVAADIDNGKITIFRPEENALRFIRSCESLAIPPISVSQFVEAIRHAVLNNRDFLPKGGKLYIRPFVVGLSGGTGAQPAKKYLFAVEVSPYGDYFEKPRQHQHPETLPGISVRTATYYRPASGRHKVSGNYASTFPHKIAAKQAGNDEVLLVTRNRHIQENRSSNVFFIAHNKKRYRRNPGKKHDFTICTPPLTENILPGITRGSLLTLLGDPGIQKMLGCTIEVVDNVEILESWLGKFDGAFSTGTAAGITNISEINFRRNNNNEKRGLKPFAELPAQQLIKKLHDLLVMARRGELPGYEHWAMVI